MDLFSKYATIKRIVNKIKNKITIHAIIFKCDGDFWKIKSLLDDFTGKPERRKYLMAYEEIMKRHCSWIGNRVRFDGKPEFPHGMKGVFISHGARIGKNCTIFQQVTIGSNRFVDSKGKGAPIIGDNCFIGAGAKVIGNARIGNNCRIGANCVVVKDMPDNSVAVLPPPRIVLKHYLDNNAQIPLDEL